MRAPRPARGEEDAIQAAVIAHWRLLGVPGSLVAAVPNKRAFGQAGLSPGLFDLVVLSPTLGRQTGWLELKTASGRLSPAQREFREILILAGVPYAITFGRDEPIKVLEAWGAVKVTRDGRRQTHPRLGAPGAQAGGSERLVCPGQAAGSQTEIL